MTTHVARNAKPVAMCHTVSPEEHVVAAQFAVFLVQLELKSLCPDRLMSQLLTAEIFPSERLIDLVFTLITLLRLLPSVERKANLCCPLFAGVLYPPAVLLFLFVCFLFCQILTEELLSQLPLPVHTDPSILDRCS